MARPQHHFNWHEIVDEQSPAEAAELSRHRLVWLWLFFAVATAGILARAAQLELRDGEAYRQLAARPIERRVKIAPVRGRILARDGMPLALDRTTRALAIEFRHLQQPLDPTWLRQQAKKRLPRAQRRDAAHIAAMEVTIQAEMTARAQRLAEMCDMPWALWQARASQIDRRVSAMADRVNERRQDAFFQQAGEPESDEPWSLADVLTGLFAPPAPLPPPPVVIAEQTAFYPLAEDISDRVVDEIARHPQAYPGVKIVDHVRRTYPHATLAAHLLGYVNPVSAADPGSDPSGQMGLELGANARLLGREGRARRDTDRRGNLLNTTVEVAPTTGEDLVLTLDVRLQSAAEQLLDHWLQRVERPRPDVAPESHSGAIVVMDVRSGEILAAASAPRFDPNWFATADPGLEDLLRDPRRPLFDRVVKMSLPPGSVFKPLTALALIERAGVDPQVPFRCQGYLRDPEQLRCQLFRQHGIGHGDVTLADALAQSCNVYFFHHANTLGSAAIIHTARQFGFGQPSGIELPEESAGILLSPDQVRATNQTQMLAIGQGQLAVTPLQIARMYAAIANGGYLVRPRILRATTVSPDVLPVTDASPDGEQIEGLTAASLAAVHEGLCRAIDDPNGTAYETVRTPGFSVAGKTGTAEAGGKQTDHAWFAGYAPADAPRYAFVIVLEHAGSGATIAGTLAKQLLARMRHLDYLDTRDATATRPLPPGKG